MTRVRKKEKFPVFMVNESCDIIFGTATKNQNRRLMDVTPEDGAEVTLPKDMLFSTIPEAQDHARLMIDDRIKQLREKKREIRKYPKLFAAKFHKDV